ncbi:MAG: Potassium-transporting ATPase C chain [uncultured Sphingomonadaceae bacterium]|uniref:Potassium-transporting ATPase KdpC subunit n=1 Tax=uncultured Sphingomonadaceae bacterium TaxID=169976 RepID=A0A6J4TRX0_9SPHN|nr:MAG: Potassium-transporting ATPase C chain [uncultured Sphingomonadaceae bacterium]
MGIDLRQAIRPAIVVLLLMTVLLGLLYPLAILGLGQAIMPHQANGSLVRDGDRVVGSALIGQSFATPGYFNGRPSAAGEGYDASASSGSNLGPTSRALIDRVKEAAPATGLSNNIPADLVTASASGLDPHLSPAAALAQAGRVAAARGLSVATVRNLVTSNTEAPLASVLGEPRVNVLALNRQLDRLAPNRAGAAATP